jgi:hypothetical protein
MSSLLRNRAAWEIVDLPASVSEAHASARASFDSMPLGS